MKQCTTTAAARRNIDHIDRRIDRRIGELLAGEAREYDRLRGASASA